MRETEKLFVEKLGLATVATCGDHVALRRNRILLALKPATCEEDTETLEKSGTVCNNIVFRVSDLQAAYEKASKAGAKIVKRPHTLSDTSGCIRLFTIQSPFTNVTHTIVENTDYNGVYLPGYEPYTSPAIRTCENINSGISHVDHIACVCNTGDSEAIAKWYEKCLTFTQFRLGTDSDEITVGYSDGGIKLLAMEYWRCAERGVKSTGAGDEDIKLVLAESLPSSGEYNELIQMYFNIRVISVSVTQPSC